MGEMTVQTTVKKFNGDSVSPILIFRRLQAKTKFFYESSRQYMESGHYTYIGVNPVKSFIGQQQALIEMNHLTGEQQIHEGDPLQLLKQMAPIIKTDLSFDLQGGLIGFMTYESFLNEVDVSNCEIQLPLLQFDLYPTMVVYDHLTDDVYVIHHELEQTYEEANIDRFIDQIFQGDKGHTQLYSLGQFKSVQNDEQFKGLVARAKGKIDEGVAVQLFLSRRYTGQFDGDAFSLYREMRKKTPAPNMFYLQYESFCMMGVAPESVLSIKEQHVYVSPITGARPRGQTAREDMQMELHLLQNSCEVNAHNILVDTVMTDLNSICLANSVQMVDYMRPVQFKHSIRLISEIEGVLQDDLHPIDALQLLIPPAISSGVPRKVAAHVVHQIEQHPRSFGGGVIGYLSVDGTMNITLLQQTMVLKNKIAYVQAGANILADTLEVDPIIEIEKKLKAFLKFE